MIFGFCDQRSNLAMIALKLKVHFDGRIEHKIKLCSNSLKLRLKWGTNSIRKQFVSAVNVVCVENIYSACFLKSDDRNKL